MNTALTSPESEKTLTQVKIGNAIADFAVSSCSEFHEIESLIKGVRPMSLVKDPPRPKK